jgi:predicted Mrr-cat superfamily restriction endonuclease
MLRVMFSQSVSYGKNYLEKFRKHAEQIRRTTGRKEIGKVSSIEGQEQIKAVIAEIVTGTVRGNTADSPIRRI